ncbi:iron-sulfur cluster assembly scaffold protein [bacterium]|nr:iron-sulfur cluster assembly scaffold protein [bacterium]
MALKYSQKVIDHFTKPQNVGEIADADAVATEGSPACGDMIKYSLKINPETKVVEDIKFLSFGCASNIATASMMTLLAKGKTIDEIKKMKHRELTESLDGLPAVKMHCSVLAVDALKSALKKWEIEHGFAVEEKEVLDRKNVWKALTDCLNPRTGVSVVHAKLINKLEVEPGEGSVFVEVMLCELDDMFAEALEEEIHEKIEALPGVEKVLVQFKPCIHCVE